MSEIKAILENLNLEASISDLIISSDVKLRLHPQNVKVYIPAFLLQHLKDEMRDKYKYANPGNGIVYVEGIQIVIGYDLKIILAHDEYPRYQESWMYAEKKIA